MLTRVSPESRPGQKGKGRGKGHGKRLGGLPVLFGPLQPLNVSQPEIGESLLIGGGKPELVNTCRQPGRGDEGPHGYATGSVGPLRHRRAKIAARKQQKSKQYRGLHQRSLGL